ncbi:hypothetical protein [Roseibium sp. RKSG952]|uniref:hypothetical protein n=1 Tax=Roseibium sp. RKSG952 TaxID=2529384 RepID=UPI0012BD64D5|nr:hypothetical protein [Roseibium sp. RKSG952]MTH97984.1 hypothetical protein [Roseibium sp. RKSG952]
MIALEDVIAMSGLPEETIDAVAEHEQVPHIVAASLGACLLTVEDGAKRIEHMFRDNICAAIARNDHGHASELMAAMRVFLKEHAGRSNKQTNTGRGSGYLMKGDTPRR